MEITLSPELTAMIERQIASGDYHSPDEVIAAALLQLEVRDIEIEAERERE
jgi:putative addiction module CopG family antidote